MSSDNTFDPSTPETTQPVCSSCDGGCASGSVETAEEKAPRPPLKVSAAIEKLRAAQAKRSPVEQMESYLQFMKEQLNPAGPNFRDFWQARHDCTGCLRQIEEAAAKSSLLEQLQQLCAEAKGLKTMLDEQSQFAIEQIELAIEGLERELHALEQEAPHWYPQMLPQRGPFDLEFYASRQGLLNWLNSFSARVGALRKELIKTEMRVRSKNRLFSRLSEVGDQIFPRRKELIREISECFSQDVAEFAHALLGAQQLHLLSSKEEIKIWQGLAKELTLNTHAFKKTRELLSACWEHLKKLDKELHQQRSAQKSERKARFHQLQQQLEELNRLHQAGQVQERMLVSRLDELARKLRKEELLREDSELLREQMRKMKQPIVDRQEQEREEHSNKQQAIAKQRGSLLQGVVAKFEQLRQEGKVESIEWMQQQMQQMQDRIGLNQEERDSLEQIIQDVRDLAFEVKVEGLLQEVAEVDPEQIEQLLSQLFECRSQLRTQLEEHRRLAGASGLDFRRAMLLSERSKREKERIERVEETIISLQARLG